MRRGLHAGRKGSGGFSLNVFTQDEIDDIHLATLEVLERTGLEGHALADALRGVQALIVRSGTRVTEEALRGAPSLRVVVCAGTGLDNVDLVTARELGVFICTCA